MRVLQHGAERILSLSEDESTALVEACVLILITAQSDNRFAIPDKMSSVLFDLYQGLRPGSGPHLLNAGSTLEG